MVRWKLESSFPPEMPVRGCVFPPNPPRSATLDNTLRHVKGGLENYEGANQGLP
jgi:hypothetical protein